MVSQKLLIFDYDDTIMPSVITRKLSKHPDYGAKLVKEHLDTFYRFIQYWKLTTGIPIIILSAGTIAYLHLISLYGRQLKISINYFDPRMDLCMFIPFPFTGIVNKNSNYLTLTNDNDVSVYLQNNMIHYYYSVFSKYKGSNYFFIHPGQLNEAATRSNETVPDSQSREFINGISHKKVVYVQHPLDEESMNACFYLPGINYYKEVGFYEFLNCRRQFKNLDALRKHISFVTGKPSRSLHFYFFDDRSSHLGMGDDDIYLSKPHTCTSSLFVSKILPILEGLMTNGHSCNTSEGKRECMRRQEIKLLNRLVTKLSSEKKLVFVAKHDGASPVSKKPAATAIAKSKSKSKPKGKGKAKA